jgi:ribosomal protein S18 acetylase RimI-like enzyme
VRIRAARHDTDDAQVIAEMFVEAVAWRPGSARPSVEEMMASPHLARYVRGWGRSGDVGVIAESDDGVPLGAAWWRMFTADDHGYGFVAPSVPEVSVAVVATARGSGLGTALLSALLDQAPEERVAAVSLSVEEDNPAVRLYERLGFVAVGRVENAWTMRMSIAAEQSRSSPRLRGTATPDIGP